MGYRCKSVPPNEHTELAAPDVYVWMTRAQCGLDPYPGYGAGIGSLH